MSLIKRTLLYITRKKGRSLLLFAIFFVVAVCVLTAIAVKTSADREIARIGQSLGNRFVLQVDLENADEEDWEVDIEQYASRYIGPLITEEQIEQIRSLEGVSDYVDELTVMIWTELQLIPGAWANYYDDDQKTLDDMEGDELLLWEADMLESLEYDRLKTQEPDIHCCSNGERQELFRNGAFEITEGRNIQEGDQFKVVISEELAEWNGLSVGDTFSVECKEGTFRGEGDLFATWGEPAELEIVGLFRTNFEMQPSSNTYENIYAGNVVFADLAVKEWLMEIIQEHGMLPSEVGEAFEKVTFFVDDPAQLEEVLWKVRAMHGMDGLTVDSEDETYQISVEPLQAMRGFCAFFLVASLLVFLIVLYLLMGRWIKSRRQEIGILICIGMKKSQILMQFLLESILVAMAALVFAVSASAITVDRVGTLAQQMVSPEEQEEIYATQTTDYEFSVEKNASGPIALDYQIEVPTVLSGVLLILVFTAGSVTAASVPIINRKPIDILTNG